MSETLQQRAKRIKGYFSDKSTSQIKSVCKTADGFCVEPKIIHSVADYLKIISEVETSTFNPIFYHGHANANYYLIPTVMRSAVKMKIFFLMNSDDAFQMSLRNANRL